MEIRSVRGMQDLFGPTLEGWQWVEKKVADWFYRFGYSEIRTPVLEKKEVFCDSVGSETDIVQKQMYFVAGDGEETLALRPEGTAGFIRAVLEHKLTEPNLPQRYYYYLPMFRHERPQKGRLRQFHQYGAEFILDPTPEADAEVIFFLYTLFRELGLSDFKIGVNNVGTSTSREVYKNHLKAFLKEKFEQLCDLCQTRFERSVLRVLDCKNPSCKAIVAQAPSILDCLDTSSKEHHEILKKRLQQLGVPFEEDPMIVRGLDYYCKTTFEFTSTLLGAQSALAGGGRYDGISERFGAKPFAAVGFGMGMERLMLALEEKKLLPEPRQKMEWFLAPLGEAAYEALLALYWKFKAAGLPVGMSFERKNLKQQLRSADRSVARYVAILGDNELEAGHLLVKEMATGAQRVIAFSEFEALVAQAHDQPLK